MLSDLSEFPAIQPCRSNWPQLLRDFNSQQFSSNRPRRVSLWQNVSRNGERGLSSWSRYFRYAAPNASIEWKIRAVGAVVLRQIVKNGGAFLFLQWRHLVLIDHNFELFAPLLARKALLRHDSF